MILYLRLYILIQYLRRYFLSIRLYTYFDTVFSITLQYDTLHVVCVRVCSSSPRVGVFFGFFVVGWVGFQLYCMIYKYMYQGY